MKVVLLTTSFPIRNGDVSGVFVQRLATALSRFVEVSVIAPAGLQEAQEGTYELHPVRYAPRKWQRLAHAGGGIPEALRRRDPAILFLVTMIPALFVRTWLSARSADIVHGNWSIPSVIGALAAKLAGRPSVATLRGEDVTRAQSSRVFRLFLGLTVRLSSRIFCVSQAITEAVCGLYPSHASKIVFMPNGVSSGPLRQRPHFESPVELVTVGSCIRRKRHDLIVRAMAEPGLRGKFRLKIIGDGPLRGEVEALAEALGVREDVDFTGALPPDQALAGLSSADIFVLPSESEGRPNALMEAMACGLPSVASDIDGVRELLGADSGLTFSAGSHWELADCLKDLVNDPGEALRMGARGAVRIQEMNLTWESCASRHLEEYEAIVNKERQGRKE